jgi:hypothetical protein
MGHSPVDVSLSFATGRTIIDPKIGQPGSAIALEWFITVAMSPVLADQLHQVLAVVLEDYRKKFGAIPKDPNFKIEMP